MAIQRHPIQDRRSVSRSATPINCRFTYEGTEYRAFLQDISLSGLSILSRFTPPLNAEVSVNLESPLMSRPLTLKGRVLRRDHKCLDRGAATAFVVVFSQSSPELVRLVYQLPKPE